MALEDMFKSNAGKIVALGLGLVILTPILLPALVRVARPSARAAIKSGMILYEKGVEVVAELGEVVEDLVAEASAELEEDRQAVVVATAETSAETTVTADAEHTPE
jgi:hypothetical protein